MDEYDSSAYWSTPLVERLRGLNISSADEAADALEAQFSASLWARAEAEMEPYHAQVQGFLYEHIESGGNVHVVRDLTLPPKQQVIWKLEEDHEVCKDSETAARREYDRCHRLMMRAIRVRQISMTWTHYLWGVTSGHFEKEPETNV
ncbi:hypothetical protein [Roseobacter phage RDJL6]|nr:hypothetical protein [Roseobacter phage RDJL6]